MFEFIATENFSWKKLEKNILEKYRAHLGISKVEINEYLKASVRK